VLLVDAHTVVREALRELIEREHDLKIVGQASSPVDANALDVSPDVIVADFDLHDASAGKSLALLRRRFPGAAVLLLTTVDHPERVQHALVDGASGYLLKTASPPELMSGLRALARGETFLQPCLGVTIARWNRSCSDGPNDGLLTPREATILKLVALGHTNCEIAALLNFSLRTIEMHRSRMLQKLGQPRRHDLIRYALDLGLVDRADDSSGATPVDSGHLSA
jgi:DNA-binding NarL/FixJ family response regulator